MQTVLSYSRPSNGCFSDAALAVLLVVCLWPSPTAGVSPNWQPWSNHETQCSTTCGEGVRCRRRDCIDSSSPARTVVNVDMCVGGEKASRDCLPCRAYVICPQNGGWSEWAEWTDCMLNKSVAVQKVADKEAADSAAAPIYGGSDDAAKTSKARKEFAKDVESQINNQHLGLAMPARGDALEFEEKCGAGTRQRVRACDNPPPGPQGMRCGGGRSGHIEKEVCTVPCSDDLDFLTLAKNMLAEDLAESPNQLVYVNYGAPATLECDNEAYSLTLSSVTPSQLLQIDWRRNNVSVLALKTKVEHILRLKKDAKGLLDSSEEPSKAVGKISKLEMAQIRAIGTQLIIDPVDAVNVGLYACYMVLDDQRLLMRTFTLLTRQLVVRQHPETQSVVMLTNTETFLDAQLPYMDAAKIRWYHNGIPRREHLLADWFERKWSLTLSPRHTGAWECYLVLDELRQWKTNEFKLQISRQAGFMEKFSDQAKFFAACALIVYALIGFPLAVMTLRQREDSWITAEEQRCIEHVRQLNYLYMARYLRIST